MVNVTLFILPPNLNVSNPENCGHNLWHTWQLEATGHSIRVHGNETFSAWAERIRAANLKNIRTEIRGKPLSSSINRRRLADALSVVT